MGLFSSIARNVSRVVSDVAPIAAFGAQLAVPGLGGQVLGNVISGFGSPDGAAPVVSSPAVQARGGSVIAARPCPRRGILGRAFSAPFQARNFATGGAVPGRVASTFQRRSVVGRLRTLPVRRRLPAVSACPCPQEAAFRRF